ncbi:MAG TPA: GAF domain-containing protein [Candidatus Dormibacteraeota bacterium]
MAENRAAGLPGEEPTLTDLGSQDYHEQIESLYWISVEIAALHELPAVYDRVLGYCLALTGSEFGFIGLADHRREHLEMVAVRGFEPDPGFFDRFRTMPLRPNVFSTAILEDRPVVSNDVPRDPHRVGQPRGHPPVRRFLGVPLRVGSEVIGMNGVANKPGGYHAGDEQLMSTFANQVAVAIDNARLYERQREMIDGLQQLHARLDGLEKDRLLAHERARIASGLHDHIGQSLFGTGLKLNALLGHDLDPPVRETVSEVQRQITTTAEELRQVVFQLSELRPNTDLHGAIGAMLRAAAREHGLDVDLSVSGVPAAGVEEVEDVLLSVAREALANVVKHAHAQRVHVSLTYADDHVDLAIQDDGEGASEEVLEGYGDSYLHYGLRNLRRRVEEIGGTFTCRNGDERGFLIRVHVPLRPEGE